jgi:hypothetical protein
MPAVMIQDALLGMADSPLIDDVVILVCADDSAVMVTRHVECRSW